MKLAEKLPFIEADEEEERGRVRLLGKLEEIEDFDTSDFNELVKGAVNHMGKKRNGESVILDDRIRNEKSEEDLMDRHLAYDVKVGESKVASGEDGNEIVEGPTLKVILRAQPSKAIEINGPFKISRPYKESLKKKYSEQFGGNLDFQDILTS